MIVYLSQNHSISRLKIEYQLQSLKCIKNTVTDRLSLEILTLAMFVKTS